MRELTKALVSCLFIILLSAISLAILLMGLLKVVDEINVSGMFP